MTAFINFSVLSSPDHLKRRPQIAAITVILASMLLSACGGGSEELCGANNQTFSIDFEESSYEELVGEATTISSKIFPESCRSVMTVDVRTGSLPPGMNIVNGNLEGEPSEAGEFKVQLSITAVQGYQSQSFAPSVAPRSREITVFVR